MFHVIYNYPISRIDIVQTILRFTLLWAYSVLMEPVQNAVKLFASRYDYITPIIQEFNSEQYLLFSFLQSFYPSGKNS